MGNHWNGKKAKSHDYYLREGLRYIFKDLGLPEELQPDQRMMLAWRKEHNFPLLRINWIRGKTDANLRSKCEEAVR